MEPEIVWGVFLRLLGAVHGLLFFSLFFQLDGLIGPNGLQPVQESLREAQKKHGIVKGFWLIPTVFWLSGSTTMIRAFIVFGLACSFCLMIGVFSQIAIAFLYVLYFSLSNGGGNFFMFPWDFFIIELTLACIGLPSLRPIWISYSVQQPVQPLVAFGIKFLLIRLMFGFGIEKFWFPDEKTKKGTYIKRFLAWQPHPTPLAWYLQKLPKNIHILTEVGLFFIEVIVPPVLLICLGNQFIQFSSMVLIISLQIGIQLSGNFGHFNVLSAVAALSLLDCSTGWSDILRNAVENPLLGLLIFVQGGSGVFYLSHQLELGGVLAANWSGWLFLENPSLWGRPIPEWFLSFQRFVTRFHIAHGYGVFRHTYPCTSLSLEGSADAIVWTPLKFHVYHQPYFIAPWQWRLDYMMRYESGGLSFALDLVSGINRYWHPAGPNSLLVRLVKGICNGKQPVIDLFKEAKAYNFCRIVIYDSKFSSGLSESYWINKFDFYKTIASSDEYHYKKSRMARVQVLK